MGVTERGTAARVLRLLHHRGPTPRSTITSELGLARSAVGNALAELADAGLVRTGPPADGPARRGRPSPLVEAAEAAPFAVAVALRPDAVEITTGALASTPGAAIRTSLDGARTPRSLAELLGGLIGDVIADTRRRTGRPCAGICAALPAAVREEDGFVRAALHFGWAEEPFGEMLSAQLGTAFPLRFGRDSNLAALAEYQRGAAAGADNALVLTGAQHGIGGALVSAGTVFTGGGHAVEAGHVVVDPGGPPCLCGARGCLELYADGTTFRHAGPGERREIAQKVAGGLAGLTNVLDPDRIVLTGFLAELLGAEPSLPSELRRLSVLARTGRSTLVAGSLSDPVLSGAIDRAFADLLARPRSVEVGQV